MRWDMFFPLFHRSPVQSQHFCPFPWLWGHRLAGAPAPRELHWGCSGSPEFPRPCSGPPRSRVLSWKCLRAPPAAERDPGPFPGAVRLGGQGWGRSGGCRGRSGGCRDSPSPAAPALPGLAAPPGGRSGARSVLAAPGLMDGRGPVTPVVRNCHGGKTRDWK